MNRAALRCVVRSLPVSMLLTHSTIQRMQYTTDDANNTINKSSNNNDAKTDINQQNSNDNNTKSDVNDSNNKFAEATTQASFLNDNYHFNNMNSNKGSIDNIYGDNTINYGRSSNFGNDHINNRYSANNEQMSSNNDDSNTSDVYEKINDKYEELIRQHRPLIRKVAIVILFITFVMVVMYMTGTGAYFVKEVQNKRQGKKEEQEEQNNYRKNKKEKVIGGKPLVFPLDMNTEVNTTDRDVNVNGRARLTSSDNSSREAKERLHEEVHKYLKRAI